MKPVQLVFLIASLCLAASCNKSEVVTRTITVDGNDTRVEIRGAASSDVDKAVAEASHVLQKQRESSHAWKRSELSSINAALASGKSPAVSEENLHLLEISKPLYTASDAYYDPGIGSLVRMWGFYTDKFPISAKPPSNDQIANWLAHKPDFLGIHIDKKNIGADNPNMQLDFSTILEGVAATEIHRILVEHRVDDALVTMGSDQFTIGNAESRPWTVKLKDPFGGDLGEIALQGNEALFSSGNFNKFRVAPTGSRWGHVLNPLTGKPAQGSAAVVVLHGDPILSDAASTALMAAGPGNFSRLVKRMKLACAMMVTEENELLITAQMKKRISFFRNPVPLGNPISNGDHCN